MDFDLYEEAFKEFEKFQFEEFEKTTEVSAIGKTETICEHRTTSTESGTIFCLDCSQEIEKTVNHDKEWRFYSKEQKRSTDPTRVQARKIDERTIFKDVENMGFNDKIILLANEIYDDVTKGQIYRGNSRKSIVFACIFHAFKLSGKPQTHDKLIKIFDLNRKNGLKGLKHVVLNASKDSKIHTTYITPINLVEDLMDKFKATVEQKKEVSVLYELIKNKSSKLNRARPQSVASGLTFYWISQKGYDISIKDFAKKADLSELTISKTAKEISELLRKTKQSPTF